MLLAGARVGVEASVEVRVEEMEGLLSSVVAGGAAVVGEAVVVEVVVGVVSRGSSMSLPWRPPIES